MALRDRCTMNDRIRSILLVTIAVVWVSNFVAPMFVAQYVPPPEVHLIFMAVVAGLVKSSGKDKDDSDTKL